MPQVITVNYTVPAGEHPPTRQHIIRLRMTAARQLLQHTLGIRDCFFKLRNIFL